MEKGGWTLQRKPLKGPGDWVSGLNKLYEVNSLHFMHGNGKIGTATERNGLDRRDPV